MYQKAGLLFFLSIQFIWVRPAIGTEVPKPTISRALQDMRPAVCGEIWKSYYINVTKYVASAVNERSFSDLYAEIQKFNTNTPDSLDESKFDVGEVYVFGIYPRFLCGFNLFSLGWDLSIEIKYLGNNKAELIESRVIDRAAWP